MSIPLPLTELQTETLCAAVDRIVPADDYPSGWEAGVGGYFAQLLTREPQFLIPTRLGLDALDTEARAAEGFPFAALAAEAQDALLMRLEDGTTQTEWPFSASGFFRQLTAQTLEGYYADPANGGNKDGISWQMIGYRVTD